jgi:hypothetical protein
MAAPLVLCESRVGLFATGLALVAFLSSQRILLLILGAGIYCILAWGLGVLPFDPGKLASASQRIEIWQDAISGVSMLGNGLGAFTAHFPHWEYAHSDLLQSLCELGIGTVGPVVCCVLAFQAPGHRPEKAALAVLAIEATVSFPLHLPATGFLFALLAGWLGGRRGVLRDACDVVGVPANAGA